MQCLLIKTQDDREFLTHEENFPLLIEFSRAFNAEISVVHTEEAAPLELAEIAPMICAGTRPNVVSYEVIERKMLGERKRRKTIETAEEIRRTIESRLRDGHTVSLSFLKQRYQHLGLSDSCLCNHLTAIRKKMNASKVGRGAYALTCSSVS